MAAEKMHADEVDIDAALVGRLLAAQFPEWANLLLSPFHSSGPTTRSTDLVAT